MQLARIQAVDTCAVHLCAALNIYQGGVQLSGKPWLASWRWCKQHVPSRPTCIPGKHTSARHDSAQNWGHPARYRLSGWSRQFLNSLKWEWSCQSPCRERSPAKGVWQKSDEKSDRSVRKVTKKWPKESRKQKKVIEFLLPTSFCGTLIKWEGSCQYSSSCQGLGPFWRELQ